MYSKILVPIDGSETSTRGLDEAIKIAKSQGSQLCLVHIVNGLILDYAFSPGLYAGNLFESLVKAGKAVLEAGESAAQREGVNATSVLLESIGAVAADLILQQARKFHADLIVMGTHGRRGLFRLALGSDAEEVVRAATFPVVLVRDQAATQNPVATSPHIKASAA